MDEIAKEYDVIVLGTGMSLPPPLLCCSNPPRIQPKLGTLCDGRMDGEFGASILY
jgi:hypothetical protein